MSKEISVSKLVSYLKEKNDSDPNLLNLVVMGELSNVKIYPRKHLYFDLKEDKIKISGIMFASNTSSLNFVPNAGDKVIVKGSVKVYQNNSNFQLIAQQIEKDGYGQLYLEFEKNKKLLEQEGYFDLKHKREIPAFPSKIAVIAGHDSAALKDILMSINSRYKLAQVVVFPSLVQGDKAANEIIETINLVNKYQFDVLILARGGGSFEDLNAFNDVELAKTIFNSKIPIVSGIGHEVDFTIADFVSDFRATTPTAAAVKVVPDKNNLQKFLIKQQQYLENYFYYKINSYRQNVDTYFNKLNQLSKFNIESKKMILNKLEHRLEKNNIKYKLQENKQKIYSYHLRLSNIFPYIIEKNKIKIENRYELLNNQMNDIIKEKKQKVNESIIKLNLLDPNNITNKGYAIVYNNGRIIKTIDDVSAGDTIEIVSKNYHLNAMVNEVSKNGK